MLANTIRIGVKNGKKEGLIEYFSLPIYWRSENIFEESLNFLIEHNKFVKKYNSLKHESDKEKLINEIKNKEWFYSGLAHCEEQAVLSGENLDLKKYKEELKNLSLNINQKEWVDYLFLKRDDGERFVVDSFWEKSELSLYNVKKIIK